MSRKDTEMINNNLDFEKNSNSTAATRSGGSDGTMPNASTPSAAATVAAAATNYFNRFDNRIAANLAAVLNGSRFRSSSVGGHSHGHGHGHTKATRPPNRTNQANHANANANEGGTMLRKSRDQTTLHLQLNNTKVPTAATGVVHVGDGDADGDVDGNVCGSASGSENGSMGRRRPVQLFTQTNLNCNDNEKTPRGQTCSQTTPPSSDEDNSPTELNNCKRLADKPPLVKRLTMGLLRGHEESRPLVHHSQTVASNSISSSTTSSSSSNNSSPAVPPAAGGVGIGYRKTPQSHSPLMVGIGDSNQLYSNGYINEEAFEPEKYIASKFGDSCRQSLTAIPMLDTLNLNDNSEFNLKKRYLRETSSANSSPKIFANRLRMNATTSRYSGNGTAIGPNSNSSYGCHTMAGDDVDETDLKDASWFQAGISRDIAVEVLASKSPGAFLVRKSSSKPGCYALTLRVPSPPGPKIANYIILRTARGYKIKGFRKEFTSLKALITHHSVMPELLPVPLAMPRPTNMTSSRRNLDDFDTYDSLQMLLKYLRAKNMENE